MGIPPQLIFEMVEDIIITLVLENHPHKDRSMQVGDFFFYAMSLSSQYTACTDSEKNPPVASL